jgi:quercetin dioxygenase-like cupin family protein
MTIRNIYEPHQVRKGRHGGNFEVNWVYENQNFSSLLDHAVLVTVPPGGSIPEHPHDTNEELYLILDGSPLVYDDGEPRRAVEGDLLLTSPGHRHRLDNDTTEPVRVFVVNTDVQAS